MLKILAKVGPLSRGTPTQFTAIEAFNGDHSDYLNKTTLILNAVGEYVYKNLKSNRVHIQKPEE